MPDTQFRLRFKVLVRPLFRSSSNCEDCTNLLHQTPFGLEQRTLDCPLRYGCGQFVLAYLMDSLSFGIRDTLPINSSLVRCGTKYLAILDSQPHGTRFLSSDGTQRSLKASFHPPPHINIVPRESNSPGGPRSANATLVRSADIPTLITCGS